MAARAMGLDGAMPVGEGSTGHGARPEQGSALSAE
jgi:hypothetical protein